MQKKNFDVAMSHLRAAAAEMAADSADPAEVARAHAQLADLAWVLGIESMLAASYAGATWAHIGGALDIAAPTAHRKASTGATRVDELHRLGHEAIRVGNDVPTPQGQGFIVGASMAAALGVSITTVRKMAADGKLEEHARPVGSRVARLYRRKDTK